MTEPAHPLQQVLDNPWLLLAVGVLVPLVSYVGWGWLDLAQTPLAQLP